MLNKSVPSISKLSLKNIKTNQQLDYNCQLVQKYLSTHQAKVKLEVIRNLTLSDKPWERALRNDKFEMIDGILYFNDTNRILLVLPLVLRLIAIAIVHCGVHHTHPGAQVTIDKIKRNYWWPEIDDDVEYFISYCDLCQLIKHTLSQQEMEPFFPNEPGQVVEYDFWGTCVWCIFIFGFLRHVYRYFKNAYDKISGSIGGGTWYNDNLGS